MKPVTHIRKIAVGESPIVVGTVSSRDFLASAQVQPRDCDWIELRADLLGPPFSEIWQAARTFLQQGFPIIGTIRLQAEGGRWAEDNERRWQEYQAALPSVTCIDVELISSILERACQATRAAGVGLIVSFHDFEKTPSSEVLEQKIQEAERWGDVVKIVTTLQTEADLKRLESLLARPRTKPLCLMGMGPLGRETRVTFPRLGSALTYGFLDQSAAPGQRSSAELVEALQGSLE